MSMKENNPCLNYCKGDN